MIKGINDFRGNRLGSITKSTGLFPYECMGYHTVVKVSGELHLSLPNAAPYRQIKAVSTTEDYLIISPLVGDIIYLSSDRPITNSIFTEDPIARIFLECFSSGYWQSTFVQGDWGELLDVLYETFTPDETATYNVLQIASGTVISGEFDNREIVGLSTPYAVDTYPYAGIQKEFTAENTTGRNRYMVELSTYHTFLDETDGVNFKVRISNGDINHRLEVVMYSKRIYFASEESPSILYCNNEANKWIRWKFDVLKSSNGAFCRVFKDDVLVGENIDVTFNKSVGNDILLLRDSHTTDQNKTGATYIDYIKITTFPPE